MDGARGETARRIAFAIGAYDRTRPLVIDPVLEYSTYLGGTSFDGATDVTVDGSGNVIVVGNTSSPTFPGVTASSIDPANAPVGGAFVTKLNAAGTAILYSTFLSGTADPMNANAVAVDAAGNAYVVGGSAAPDMPGITAASMDTFTVNNDAYIVKIDPTGSAILYGTFLGEDGGDNGNGVAVDAAGNAYVSGDTSSTTFLGVTAGSLQSVNAGPTDYFLTKINPGGTATVYSTFLGGSGLELEGDVAIDPAGNAYVTGWSASPTFPGVTGASLQPSNAGGIYDATVTKLAASGTSIVYSTFLGGSGWDTPHDIAVTPAGDAWITGETDSPSFPGASSSFIQPLPGGGRDAFVAKLGPAGTTLPVSTYLGGAALDVGTAIAVDADGTAYVAGATRSATLPGIGPGSIQPTNAGGADAFVSAIEARGLLIHSTFLGGSQDDEAGGIAADGSGGLYVVGSTASPGFPGVSPSSIQPTFAGVRDAFVTRITGMGFVFGIPALSRSALVLLAGLLAGVGLLLVRRLRPN